MRARVRYPVVMPNQMEAITARVMASSMPGRRSPVLVVYGDAALAGLVVPVLDELLHRGDAAVGSERVVHDLDHSERVAAGGGSAAGDGLPRLDGGEVQNVARTVRRRERRGRGARPCTAWRLRSRRRGSTGRADSRGLLRGAGDRLSRPRRGSGEIVRRAPHHAAFPLAFRNAARSPGPVPRLIRVPVQPGLVHRHLKPPPLVMVPRHALSPKRIRLNRNPVNLLGESSETR